MGVTFLACAFSDPGSFERYTGFDIGLGYEQNDCHVSVTVTDCVTSYNSNVMLIKST